MVKTKRAAQSSNPLKSAEYNQASKKLKIFSFLLRKVKLLSDALGDFYETFRWEILSSSRPLTLVFTGRVVGPSFEVDCDVLDYGIVSFGFHYAKSLTLRNTSEIPMRYTWRVDGDSINSPEFQMVPRTGMVLPKGKEKITIDFTPQSVSLYSKQLQLDVLGVGDGLLTVPIDAECAVPKIDIESEVLEFGECYIRYACKKSFTLINASKLPAKFQVLPQDAHSKSLALFSAEPSSGGISAQVPPLITCLRSDVIYLTHVTHEN